MILPKGTLVFENLTSTMINIDGFFDELKKRRLTGYVTATTSDISGIIFFRDGVPVNAIEEMGSDNIIGESSLTDLVRRCQTESVALDVSELSTSILNAVIGLLNSDMVYENLRSDFVSLDKLLMTLEAEKHTGCLKITMDADCGVLFFENGIPIDGTFVRSDGTDVAGSDSLNMILDASEQTNATITVYRADMVNSTGDLTITGNSEELLEVYNEVISGIEARINSLIGSGRFNRELTSAIASHNLKDLTYDEGVIVYTGELNQSDFVSELNSVIAEAIGGVSTIIPKRTIESSIRMGLKDLTAAHKEEIKRFGIYETIFKG